MPDTGQKRKRPPTFQHFPAQRAKKLKKAWVEKAKIKSKWKAQKRREGIASSSRLATLPGDDNEPHDSDVGSADEDDRGSDHSDSESTANNAMATLADDSQAESASESAESQTQVPSNSTDAAHLPPSPPPRQPRPPPPKKKYNQNNNKKRPLPHDKNNNTAIRGGTSTNEEQDKPSLRDLFREAYSKESLHSYKSDPLKKGRGDQRVRGRGGRGGSGASARGRGQPNMKLRMNAMLEKIKRDYS
ncbi:hypothetical protein D9756_001920 [Leucocoprinus leucothites]|uniref:rRNA-processing protein FYV7 n=1 Tax=Leucocoprinus leucothites TaxID=201217 RepID=A0A8H5G503_9AGAR|nr:hypothetical protein D9756_001920 [Leucoagaricus leucothites]